MKKKAPLDNLVKIEITANSQHIACSAGKSLLDSLVLEGININHSCGGNGTCGTCAVTVNSGAEKLPPKNDLEIEISKDRAWGENVRLACQIEPVAGLSISFEPGK